MSAWFEQPVEGAAAAPPPLCERVAQVATAELLPLVRSIDEGHYPERVLRRLGEVGAFSPHASAPDGLFPAIEAMAAVGRHCLSTAFCVWCQDTFAWYLANTGNLELRERLLGGARGGSVLGGTGLSNPMKATCGIEPMRLVGREVPGGFVVSGTLPWVSNLGPDHHFGTAFQVEGEDRQVMALVDCSLPGIRLGGAARFLALDGTRTFSVGFREVFIPRALVLADPAAPFIARVKAGFILLQTGMALGAIRGCVDVMLKADETQEHVNRFLEDRPPLFLEALEGLEAEIAGPLPDAVRDLARVRAPRAGGAALRERVVAAGGAGGAVACRRAGLPRRRRRATEAAGSVLRRHRHPGNQAPAQGARLDGLKGRRARRGTPARRAAPFPAPLRAPTLQPGGVP